MYVDIAILMKTKLSVFYFDLGLLLMTLGLTKIYVFVRKSSNNPNLQCGRQFAFLMSETEIKTEKIQSHKTRPRLKTNEYS